jgi:hypothetical protein
LGLFLLFAATIIAFGGIQEFVRFQFGGSFFVILYCSCRSYWARAACPDEYVRGGIVWFWRFTALMVGAELRTPPSWEPSRPSP